MIDNYLRTSLIFYDAAEKQDWRKKVLHNIRIPKAQLTERYRLPPFSIRSTDLIGVPTVFKLYSKHTDIETADLLDPAYGGAELLSLEWDGTYYWLIYDGETHLSAAMPMGEHYVKISDGIRTWESEIIDMCDCKENDYMGDFVFLANQDNGLEVYSIDSNGLLTHIDNDDQGGAYFGVWADKNFVYVANQTLGLEVYSVSGTGILTFLDSNDPGGVLGLGYDVWGDGKFIYLANDGNRGVEVFSVSDTGIITHLGNHLRGGGAWSVWGDGKFIYVANVGDGLDVYSISDLGILTHLDNDDQGGSAYHVWGDGRFIYLANSDRGIEVYSVSDLGILTHIDNDDQGGSALGVWGDGRFIYLANQVRGLEVYSVSDLGILTHLDNDDQGGQAYGVRGDGRFIYLANANRGIEVYSVSDLGILTHLDNDLIASNGIKVFANRDVDCTPIRSKITIEYENTHDFAGILSEYIGRVHLCADIRKPDSKIIKSGIEREGELWIQKVITQKIYRFNILCTESLIDTLTMIPSYETITVHFDNESAEVKEFSVAPPEWKYEGLGQLEISFIVESIIKTNCDEDYELQEELLLNGDFSEWDDVNTPTHWNPITAGTSVIKEVAPNEDHTGTGNGACNIYSPDGNDARIYQDILEVGKTYLYKIEFTKVASGRVFIRSTGGTDTIIPGIVGIHKFIVTYDGTDDRFIIDKSAVVACDVTIDNVSVKPYS